MNTLDPNTAGSSKKTATLNKPASEGTGTWNPQAMTEALPSGTIVNAVDLHLRFDLGLDKIYSLDFCEKAVAAIVNAPPPTDFIAILKAFAGGTANYPHDAGVDAGLSALATALSAGGTAPVNWTFRAYHDYNSQQGGDFIEFEFHQHFKGAGAVMPKDELDQLKSYLEKANTNKDLWKTEILDKAAIAVLGL